jgi:hypothetical protein
MANLPITVLNSIEAPTTEKRRHEKKMKARERKKKKKKKRARAQAVHELRRHLQKLLVAASPLLPSSCLSIRARAQASPILPSQPLLRLQTTPKAAAINAINEEEAAG